MVPASESPGDAGALAQAPAMVRGSRGLTNDQLNWPMIEAAMRARESSWILGGHQIPPNPSVKTKDMPGPFCLPDVHAGCCLWRFITVSAPWAGPPRPPSWACSLHPPSNAPVPRPGAPSLPSALWASSLLWARLCSHIPGSLFCPGPCPELHPKTCLPPLLLNLGDPSLPHSTHPPPAAPASEHGVTSHPCPAGN